MEPTQLLYLDPAATSALISSLTALVVAVGASGIVIWRKLKKKVDKTLNKDPNANKEVEDELIINDEEDVKPAEENVTETPVEAPFEEVTAEETPAAPAPEEKPKTSKTKKK